MRNLFIALLLCLSVAQSHAGMLVPVGGGVAAAAPSCSHPGTDGSLFVWSPTQDAANWEDTSITDSNTRSESFVVPAGGKTLTGIYVYGCDGNNIGSVTVEFKAASSAGPPPGDPTGSVLATSTVAMSTVAACYTYSDPGIWFEFATPVTFPAGTYCWYARAGGTGAELQIKRQNPGASSDFYYNYSSDGGSTWLGGGSTAVDLRFDIYGCTP